MPEGHILHRVARRFASDLVGQPLQVTSPQGRFAIEAQKLDGLELVAAKASGKQLFLAFDRDLWVRIHLGIYGSFDFSGHLREGVGLYPASVRFGENPVFPPEPVGQTRVRFQGESALADLRGPTVCEVIGPEQVAAVLDRLGPDPLLDASEAAFERFATRVNKSGSPIAVLLMDQSVLGGVGNIYRAEMLFRARLDPFTPGRSVSRDKLRELWDDWARLLGEGVASGMIFTRDDLTPDELKASETDRSLRYWVYKHEGEACLRCGTNIAMTLLAGRKLYWCPGCQTDGGPAAG